jgi:CHASE3 domain sensor protein
MTDVALKEYLERRLDDLARRLDDRTAQNDVAVAKAERMMNDRLNSMNEFRDALRDQANRMATRVEVERLDQTVQELQRARANLDGRLLVVSAGISIAVSIVLWLLTRFVRP